jgi:hypothetical protein
LSYVDDCSLTIDNAVLIASMTTRASFSIAEWCARHHICRATYYNLKKRDEAPDVMHIGRSVRISAEADARWVAQREHAGGRGGAKTR